MRIVIGGTFDVLHEGHKALLRKAFSLGDRLLIGVTSDAMAKKTRNREVRAFRERKEDLENFLAEEYPGRAQIVKIEDVFGPALKEDFDYIVVSPETYKTALLINKERRKMNKKSIEIVKIKFVLDKGGQPLSATKTLSE